MMAKNESDSWQQSIYDELHRVAENALAMEAPGHSLQPTLLVNDAYLRLLKQQNVDSKDRSHLLAAGARIIRRMLIDHARKRKSLKRGGTAGRGHAFLVEIAQTNKELDMVELHEAMEQLAQTQARAAQIVELKFFGGLNGDEIGEVLGVSRRTVTEDWTYAKAWLYQRLSKNEAT